MIHAAALAAAMAVPVAPVGMANASILAVQDAAFIVSLPLISDDRQMGSILVETTVTELLRATPTALALVLGDAINYDARARLDALGAQPVPIAAIQALGYGLVLNPRTLAVEIDIPVTERAAQAASLSRDWLPADSEVEVADQGAFGVTGVLQIADTFDDSFDPTADLGFDGFVNFGGAGGISVDWGGQVSIREGESDFQRNRIFAFHDQPGDARRLSAGDLTPQLDRNIGVLNLLGVSVERNYQVLQPTRNIRPTGSRSLLLERRSTIEVYVNGTLVERFQAEAGPVDLRDIPLANVSNDVTILVEDALGRREIDRFSLSADVTLLSAGLSEYSLAAGVRRRDDRDGFEYDFETPVVGGEYARGITPAMTLTGSFAATPDFHTAGGAITRAVFDGVAQLNLTVSDADDVGRGIAAGLNFRGGPYLGRDRFGTLNVRIDYASPEFATLNDLTSISTTRWSAGLDFRINLTDRTAATFGLIHQDDHLRTERSSTVSMGLNRRFGDLVVAVTGRHTDFLDRDDEAGVFLTLSRRFGGRQLASASYDSFSGSSRLEYRTLRDRSLPSLSGRASVFEQDERTDVRGQLATEGTRYAAQLNAAHTPASAGLEDRNSVSLRLQSGLAFAGGSWGVGRDPGRGFALIDRHASLRDADILVSLGASDRLDARADAFGPGILSLNSPYRPQDVRIGATDLEPGYFIGAGRYTLLPGALTGQRLVIGTEAYRTAVATLWSEGEPVSLRYGSLRRAGEDQDVAFFTNRAGRAAFNELTPGRYRATLANGRVVEFVIPDDAPAYLDLGRLNMETAND